MTINMKQGIAEASPFGLTRLKASSYACNVLVAERTESGGLQRMRRVEYRVHSICDFCVTLCAFVA